jgi:Na+-driven multidrug efflux pump
MMGIEGMWLALPLSELLTFIVVVGYMFFKRSR